MWLTAWLSSSSSIKNKLKGWEMIFLRFCLKGSQREYEFNV